MGHWKVNGKLINVDKKWRHLSMRQREWIYSLFREEYIMFLKKNRWHPNKTECDQIVENVYKQIEEREIFIPFKEVQKAFLSKLNKYRRIDTESLND